MELYELLDCFCFLYFSNKKIRLLSNSHHLLFKNRIPRIKVTHPLFVTFTRCVLVLLYISVDQGEINLAIVQSEATPEQEHFRQQQRTKTKLNYLSTPSLKKTENRLRLFYDVTKMIFKMTPFSDSITKEQVISDI